MTEMYWALAGLAVLSIITVIFVFVANRRRQLRGSARKKVRDVWALIEKVDDPVMQIIEADKVLDLALTLLGFTGTTGEKLKKAGPRFRDDTNIWLAHKLRNNLAHEISGKFDPNRGRAAIRAFKEALEDLGM